MVHLLTVPNSYAMINVCRQRMKKKKMNCVRYARRNELTAVAPLQSMTTFFFFFYASENHGRFLGDDNTPSRNHCWCR